MTRHPTVKSVGMGHVGKWTTMRQDIPGPRHQYMGSPSPKKNKDVFVPWHLKPFSKICSS